MKVEKGDQEAGVQPFLLLFQSLLYIVLQKYSGLTLHVRLV